MISEQKTQQPVAGNTENGELVAALQLKRRRLLKSTVAIPVIMTLSGRLAAEVGRSSNFAGAVNTIGEAAKSANDRAVCAADAVLTAEGNRYDLGISPRLIEVDTVENCSNQAGILISQAAFTSLQGKGIGITNF